jgi:phosphoenolpyruvate-protein kinase (PTS system EI component)
VEIMVGKSAAAIFRTHEAMLESRAFHAAIRRGIEEQNLTAESAVSITVDAIDHSCRSSP